MLAVSSSARDAVRSTGNATGPHLRQQQLEEGSLPTTITSRGSADFERLPGENLVVPFRERLLGGAALSLAIETRRVGKNLDNSHCFAIKSRLMDDRDILHFKHNAIRMGMDRALGTNNNRSFSTSRS